MKEVFTDIRWANGNGEIEFTMKQDVRAILKECQERRDSGVVSHSDGLGQLECRLPLVIVQDAKEKGIDLSHTPTRRKYVQWLKDQYGWDFSTVKINSGRYSQLIIR